MSTFFFFRISQCNSRSCMEEQMANSSQNTLQEENFGDVKVEVGFILRYQDLFLKL